MSIVDQSLHLFVVAALCLLYAIFGAKLGRAHHWYPQECCSSTDCRLALDGEVIEGQGGFFIVSRGEHIGYEDHRIREGYADHTDGRYHICEFSPASHPYHMAPDPSRLVTRCLFVPPRAL